MKKFLCCILIAGGLAGLVSSVRPPPAVPAPAPGIKPRAVIPWVTPAARTFTSVRSVTPSPARVRPGAADELARALRSGTAADRDRAFNVLLPDLVARDPSQAGHLALAWEPGALREEFLNQFIRRWAAIDIGGVITWVTSLLDETDRRNAALAATTQVAQDDIGGAIELAQLLHTGVDDGSLEHLAQLWTEENPREAVDWIVRRPADPLRDRLVARIAWTRAQRDPAEAASLVLQQMTPGDTRDEALIGVVRQWAGRDPAPASAWVAQFSPGPLRTRALAEVATASRLR